MAAVPTGKGRREAALLRWGKSASRLWPGGKPDQRVDDFVAAEGAVVIGALELHELAGNVARVEEGGIVPSKNRRRVVIPGADEDGDTGRRRDARNIGIRRFAAPPRLAALQTAPL